MSLRKRFGNSADYDRQALARAIDKRACSDLWDFFDERDVRENASVWCKQVLNEDPTVKLHRFQNVLKRLCDAYGRGGLRLPGVLPRHMSYSDRGLTIAASVFPTSANSAVPPFADGFRGASRARSASDSIPRSWRDPSTTGSRRTWASPSS